MSRMSSLSSPFLLGFDEVERALDRVAKSADGYPPYNVERIEAAGEPLRLRITLAVAGFTAVECFAFASVIPSMPTFPPTGY